MPTYIKRTTSLLVFLAICWAATAAEQVNQLKPNGFVNDFANVIDSESARQIQYLCDQVDKRAQAQIAVVTVHTINGSSIENYALRLFRQWGIGPKINNRGILILLAVQDHKYRIEVGTGLEAVVTNRKAAGFGLEAVPYLKELHYGQALQVITRRVADAIAADAQITIGNAPPVQAPPVASYQSSSGSGSGATAIISFMLIAAIVCIVLVFVLKRMPATSYSYPGYGYQTPVYQNVGYYNNSNTYLYNGFGGSSSSPSYHSSSWGGGGGFGGGGDSSSFGGGSSSSSSSSSSDFGGGSSEGSGASGSW